jgi:hypothetical protein
MVLLWQLCSTRGIPAHCAYQHVLPASHVITVTVGNAKCFDEELSTEADAHAEAAYLLDHYLLQGWIDVAYRDPRIAQL